MVNGLLSIVVTSYTSDRLKDILELVDSIRNQTYPQIELIFVAEREPGLKDRVFEYARSRGIACTALYNAEQPGLSSSRNIGVDRASGEVIAFTDDDVVLDPGWGAGLVAGLADKSVIGITGPALPLWQGQPLDWLPAEFYWLISCTSWYAPRTPCLVRNAWGHSMAFRHEAFQFCRFHDSFGRTAGWDRAGKKGPVGDDTEFCINLTRASGKSILYDPGVRVLHKVYPYRLTANFVRRQAFWQGYTKARLRKVYDHGDSRGLLDTEYGLLKRILFKLLPSLPAEFFTAPRQSWKKTGVVVTALFHLSTGYAAGAVPGLGILCKTYAT